MDTAFIDADHLRRLLPFADAVDALDRAFRGALPETPQRIRHRVPAGELFLMPSAGPSYMGVKLVTVAPENPARDRPVVQAVYALFDAESLSPIAILDGTGLTSLRTAAVSALATRYLARPDARVLVIFGAGALANAHLDAMAAVREIGDVRVVSRSAKPAAALARRASSMGLHAVTGAPEVVEEADIVCTCTTSSEPVFDGSLLSAGSHVNAVGAHRPDLRELDDETVRRGRLVVETRDAGLTEAGDLLIPIERGVIGRDHVVADLAEVVAGKEVRRADEDVTVFKSVGVAFEDLFLAAAAYERFTA